MTISVYPALGKKIEGYVDSMVALQTDLTRFGAVGPESGGQGEEKKALFLRDHLTKMGLRDIQEYRAPDGRVPCKYRPNIVAKVPGKDSSRTIWVMTHMDVVPPGERSLWNADPFQVQVRDGTLIGRGVEDNQLGMVSSMFAARALLDEGVQPACDVGLILVSDEETGSHYGIGYLLKQHPDLFKKEDLIIVPDAGNPDGTMIEVAEKSILWLRFTTKGKQCHASMPEKGRNAFRAGSHLVVALEELHKKYGKRDDMFDPPISTFEPTLKEANVPNINTIPGEDVFCLDCRILPGYPLAEVESAIREMCARIEKEFGVAVSFSSPQKEQAAPPTPADAPVVQSLSRAVREVLKAEARPMGIGGGTVAALFRRAGFNAAVWSKMEESAHQPNEFCHIQDMVDVSKVLCHVYVSG